MLLSDFTYQFQFKLCSLIFLCCIAVHYASAKRFPTFTNNFFSLILIFALLDMTLNIAGCVTLEFSDTVPVWVNYLLNGLFYGLQSILPLLACVYMVYSVGLSFMKNRFLLLLFLPATLFLLTLLINPFTGLVFSFGAEGEGRIFIYGPLHFLIYATVALYLINLVTIAIIYRRKLTRKQVASILSFSVIIPVATAVQMKYPSLVLTGTGITIAIMLWDLTLQNPETMLVVCSKTAAETNHQRIGVDFLQ